MAEWFEDESLWESFYPYMFPPRRFEAAEDQVKAILELTEVEGGSVLDLCCGPGRHSVEFAKRDFEVTGVDRTRFLLDRAGERASQTGVQVEWILEDMRRFVREDAFDLALSFFTSFGYFDDKEEDVQVLGNIHRSLKQGGVCLMDVVGKEWLAKAFSPTSSDLEPDGTLVVQRREVFDDWSRIRNEWILIRGDIVQKFRFHHTIYSGQELKSIFEQAGFNDIRLCGSLQGGEYGRDASRLIVVAQKN